jgi:hypothetical protein
MDLYVSHRPLWGFKFAPRLTPRKDQAWHWNFACHNIDLSTFRYCYYLKSYLIFAKAFVILNLVNFICLLPKTRSGEPKSNICQVQTHIRLYYCTPSVHSFEMHYTWWGRMPCVGQDGIFCSRWKAKQTGVRSPGDTYCWWPWCKVSYLEQWL